PARLLAGLVASTPPIAGSLMANRRPVTVEPAPGASAADLTVKEANIREESGGVSWHLTAKQAMVFEQEGRTRLRDVIIEVQEPERSWKITGEEGDLFNARNDIEIRRHVVLISSDGLRLETEVLRWSNGDKRVWTDAPVKISHPIGVITGSGLDVRVAEETTTVTGRVRAIFERD